MEYLGTGSKTSRLLMVVVSLAAGMVGTRSVRYSARGRKTDAGTVIELPIRETLTTSTGGALAGASARIALRSKESHSSFGSAGIATVTRRSSHGGHGAIAILPSRKTWAYQLLIHDLDVRFNV